MSSIKIKPIQVVFLLLLISGILIANLIFSTPEIEKSIYVVRHAEKRTDTITSDPPLTQIGEERAKRLAKILSTERIVGLFSTPLKRTRATLQPLADQHDSKIQSYDYKGYDQLIDSIIGLEESGTFVIAGHSNTILETVQAIGCQNPIKTINDSDYQYLFKASITDKSCALFVIEF